MLLTMFKSSIIIIDIIVEQVCLPAYSFSRLKKQFIKNLKFLFDYLIYTILFV